jgi:hypothetical protein
MTRPMFSTSRAEALRSVAWSVDPSNDVEYIEAWQYSKVQNSILTLTF